VGAKAESDATYDLQSIVIHKGEYGSGKFAPSDFFVYFCARLGVSITLTFSHNIFAHTAPYIQVITTLMCVRISDEMSGYDSMMNL